MSEAQERVKFDAFAAKHGLCTTVDDELYRSHIMNWMWRAWMARAELCKAIEQKE